MTFFFTTGMRETHSGIPQYPIERQTNSFACEKHSDAPFSFS